MADHRCQSKIGGRNSGGHFEHNSRTPPMMDEAQTGPRIILASQSAIRAQILKDAGVTFEIRASSVDEAAAKAVMRDDMIGLSDQAMTLAELKAKQVSLSTNGIVIGADQMLDLEGRAFDRGLRGRSHCGVFSLHSRIDGNSRPRRKMEDHGEYPSALFSLG
ncbi:MAG: hypothetical protein EBS96_09980 [Spartobacteria bacterium]|nr:hypothetical protein [Spartobacteria bacterium]